jgi:xanthine dehydrogenase accessory factor
MHEIAPLSDPLRETARQWHARGAAALIIEVLAVRGSVPRGPGTRMLVSLQDQIGTIGGGRLEFEAIAQARAWLSSVLPHPSMIVSSDVQSGRPAARPTQPPSHPPTQPPSQPPSQPPPQPPPQPLLPSQSWRVSFALGPSLGQCCGGSVDLRFSVLDQPALEHWPDIEPRFHLMLFGAGHVGQAIVAALAPLPVSVTWVDERDDVFGDVPAGLAMVHTLSVDAPQAEVSLAPPGSFYLVLTHRHDLDLLIIEQILRRGDAGFVGLIGSATKRARFERQLLARGMSQQALTRMQCPIGIPGITGKEPAVIAASVVAQMLVLASGQLSQQGT